MPLDLYVNLHFGILPSAPARSRTLISSEKHSELQGQQESYGSVGADKKHVGSMVGSTVQTRKGEQLSYPSVIFWSIFSYTLNLIRF